MSSGADDTSTDLRPLRLALEHLSGPDGNLQLYQTVARGLHRASKQYHAAVISTVRQLILRTYGKDVAASDSPAVIAWDLLAACPAVTSLQLDLELLEGWAEEAGQQLPSAARQLQELKVWCSSSSTTEPGLRGLGRLLRGCSQLQEVDINYSSLWRNDVPSFHLMLDPDSSSMLDAMAPAARLSRWWSVGVPFDILARWAAQQPLGRTLVLLSMTLAGSTLDLGQLQSLTGLRHLCLGGRSFTSSSSLSSCSSLTSLLLRGRMDNLGALRALTGLRSLSLATGVSPGAAGVTREMVRRMEPELFSAVRPLKQLTRLCIRHHELSQVPAELGEWMPLLEELELEDCEIGMFPSSLTRLRKLELEISGADDFALPLTPALASVRTLLIKGVGAYFTTLPGLSCLSALEALSVTKTKAFSDSLSILQPLTHLRHLNISTSLQVDPAGLTVIGALQQLSQPTAPRFDAAAPGHIMEWPGSC
jgi:hypothetical protein